MQSGVGDPGSRQGGSARRGGTHKSLTCIRMIGCVG